MTKQQKDRIERNRKAIIRLRISDKQRKQEEALKTLLINMQRAK